MICGITGLRRGKKRCKYVVIGVWVDISLFTVKQILQSIGIDLTLMLTGLFGSLLMVSRSSANDIKATVIGVISGTLSANYLTGLVIDTVGLEGRAQYGVAFLLGYFGLKGVEQLVTKYIKKHEDGV